MKLDPHPSPRVSPGFLGVAATACLLSGCTAPAGSEGQPAPVADGITDAASSAPGPGGLDPASLQRFARLALDCIHRPYPNKVSHVLQSDADALPPRQLTPVFYGCYDWHSAVHGHWMLARLCRNFPDAPFVAEARTKLGESFTPERVAAEVRYLEAPGRGSFERPYGLAWLLQLAAELREWRDPEARGWAITLAPLEALAAKRFATWLEKLSHPIRTGEHSQTAFAFGLIFDWATTAQNQEMQARIRDAAGSFYLRDPAWNLAFEPGGQDFLSPGLAEADLMRRLLPPREFASWLRRFLPSLGGRVAALRPATVTDATDGKLAHLDGLNLSRAWMLDGIASGLPAGDPRLPAIRRTAVAHRRAGLAAVTGAHYAGGHWLGSFAVYLVTRRGGPR